MVPIRSIPMVQPAASHQSRNSPRPWASASVRVCRSLPPAMPGPICAICIRLSHSRPPSMVRFAPGAAGSDIGSLPSGQGRFDQSVKPRLTRGHGQSSDPDRKGTAPWHSPAPASRPATARPSCPRGSKYSRPRGFEAPRSTASPRQPDCPSPTCCITLPPRRRSTQPSWTGCWRPGWTRSSP